MNCPPQLIGQKVVPLVLENFDFVPCVNLAVQNSLLDSQDHDGLKHQLPNPPLSHTIDEQKPTAPGPSNDTQAPNSNRDHRRRREKRQRLFETAGRQPSSSLRSKHTAKAQPVYTTANAHEFPRAVGAYSSTKGRVDQPESGDDVATLLEAGFRLIEWDASASRPIVDKNQRVVAVLVGKPRDPGYSAACRRVEALMEQEGAAADFLEEDTVHKRGRFPAVNVGVTHGQGGDKPVNLKSNHAELLNRLLQDPDVQRLASLADSGFAYWAPGLYKHYHERLSRLWATHSSLLRNFNRSIYPTAAFNFGPRVRTYQHRDHLNCPYGWCAVQAFGNFNPKKGGHLILWELKLVVEFPAHSLILLPSAAITHSNISVNASETRFSFTQYCPGALFRYIDNGMMTDKDLRLKDKRLYDARMLERQTRWSTCVELLPTLKDLGMAFA